MKKTLSYTFKHALPIFFGFLPVGISYGLYMYEAGYSNFDSFFCCIVILAGSYQFLMIDLLASGASYLTIAITGLLVNSRHIFYGISFIEKFRSFGKAKYFLIYSLPDETYSLDCSHNFDETVNEKWAYILTALWVMIFWFVPVYIGGVAGKLIPFSLNGIEFALTSLFACIVVDQLKENKCKLPAIIAVISCMVTIMIFGGENFIFPSLLLNVFGLLIFRRKISNA